MLTKLFDRRVLAAVTLGVGLGSTWWYLSARGPTPQQIDAGRVLFTKTWTVDDPDCNGGDGLGPVFNARSCLDCHFQGGVGGAGPVKTAVNTFEIIDANQPNQLISGVIHKLATQPALLETSTNVSNLFGGQSANRQQTIQSMCGGTAMVNVPASNKIHFHTVDSPPLFGLGEIESISNWALVKSNLVRTGEDIRADFNGDFQRNGRGVLRMHSGRVRGRFGWKGQFASLDEFIAAACAMELGLSNPRVSQQLPGQHRGDPDAKPDMTAEQLRDLTAFVKSLPRPRQILPTDAAARERAIHGEAVFERAQCTDCHLKTVGHVEGIYTDFKLYQLQDRAVKRVGGGYGGGGGSGGGEDLFEWPEHLPNADHWQTPPLWGVADSGPYMHDGSAETLPWAIEKHLGDANHSRKLYKLLSAQDQTCLIEFLQTLKAPQTIDP